MLQVFREKFSGWVLLIIVGILLVPFALFGINNYFQTTVENYVAKVGEAEISPAQLQERLDLQRQQMRQMLGQDADLAFLQTPENKRRILDSLIDEELRFQDAKASGVEVPAAHLQQEIAAIEAFKLNGAFDPETYKQVLARNNMTPAIFQDRMVRDMVAREIVTRIGGSVFVTDAEVDAYLKLYNQTRTYSALRLRAADETLATPPSEDEIKADYEAHKSEYQTPEQIKVEYVEVNEAELKVEPLSDADLQKRYDEQKDRFVVPEQRLVSHILVEVATGADADTQKAALAKAEQLAAEIKGGKDFAEVAKASSDDQGSKQQGGDLGWLERGQSDPAFDDALFKLEAGKVSEPVLGTNGYHLIQLREVRPERRRELAEVKAELIAEYEAESRDIAYSDLAGRLVDEIHADPQSLAGPAGKLNLEIKQTELFSRAGGQGIAANPDVVKEAFSDLVLTRGVTSELVDLGKNHVVALRVIERKAPEQRALDDVRAEIEGKLRLAAQRKQLEAQVKELEAKLAAGTSLEAVATELGKTVDKADAVVRTAGNQDAALLEQVFKLARPGATPLRTSVRLSDDEYALVELTAVVDGDPKTADQAARDAAKSQLQTQWSEAETAAYLAALRKQATIKIVEERLQ